MTKLFTRDGKEVTPNAVYKNDKPGFRYTKKCGHCAGIGRIESGRKCYHCKGTCLGPTVIVPLYTERKLAGLKAAEERRAPEKAARAKERAARLAAEKAAAYEGWALRNSEFLQNLEYLAKASPDSGYWAGFRNSVIERQADATWLQLEVVQKALLRMEKAAENSNPGTQILH